MRYKYPEDPLIQQNDTLKGVVFYFAQMVSETIVAKYSTMVTDLELLAVYSEL